jgi:hypothetical protein
MATRYRKKPVVIEAMLFDGSAESGEAVEAWIGEAGAFGYASRGREEPYWGVEIRTLEGTMTADPGDYVIRGTKGEFYPCKPGPFANTFEPVS